MTQEQRRQWEEIRLAIRNGEVELRNIDLDEEVVLDEMGERITEARAEEMAQEALTHFRRGRPSLSGPREHSPHVSFRVPKQLAQRAEEVAAREGKSLSQLGREALGLYLARAG